MQDLQDARRKRSAAVDAFDAWSQQAAASALVSALAVQVPVSAEDVANVVPACCDPKDNPFLALVLACDADVLVLHPLAWCACAHARSVFGWRRVA
jgi:hypothetical protein